MAPRGLRSTGGVLYRSRASVWDGGAEEAGRHQTLEPRGKKARGMRTGRAGEEKRLTNERGRRVSLRSILSHHRRRSPRLSWQPARRRPIKRARFSLVSRWKRDTGALMAARERGASWTRASIDISSFARDSSRLCNSPVLRARAVTRWTPRRRERGGAVVAGCLSVRKRK